MVNLAEMLFDVWSEVGLEIHSLVLAGLEFTLVVLFCLFVRVATE